MPRNFKLYRVLTGWNRTLGIALIDGGTAGFVWGFVAIAIGFSLVYASVAEMASM